MVCNDNKSKKWSTTIILGNAKLPYNSNNNLTIVMPKRAKLAYDMNITNSQIGSQLTWYISIHRGKMITHRDTQQSQNGS